MRLIPDPGAHALIAPCIILILDSVPFPTPWIPNVAAIRPLLLVVLALFVLGGCATPKSVPSAASGNAELIHGYSLLYEIVSKQSNLDKALIFKNPSEPTRKLIRQIAETSTTAKRQLEEFAKLDS